MTDVRPGCILRGKYRVERVLGEGGMGVVAAATHLGLGCRVAIKLLKPEARASAALVQRFAREARTAARLRGPHAVRILDVDQREDGAPFLVMELLEGRDLAHALSDQERPSQARALAWILQACAGMAEAHAHGIVHRDLKPANLFLTRGVDGAELVKILDFGISKVREPARHDVVMTKAASTLGSPAYMAPEQVRDPGDVDARADVWALGVLLHELLSGRMPFPGRSPSALAAQIAADAPEPLPEVDARLSEIVTRCLAKRREDRYATVTELAAALAPFAEDGVALSARVASVAQAARANVHADDDLASAERTANSASETASVFQTASLAVSAPATDLSRALGKHEGEGSVVEHAAPRAMGRLHRLAIVGVALGAATSVALELAWGTPTASPTRARTDAPVVSPASGVGAGDAPTARAAENVGAPPPSLPPSPPPSDLPSDPSAIASSARASAKDDVGTHGSAARSPVAPRAATTSRAAAARRVPSAPRGPAATSAVPENPLDLEFK